jgi:hypothetical protein
MKNITLIVEIIFFEVAKKSFNFPICHSLRTSFWLLGTEFSTFSEIQIIESNIKIWKPCLLKLITVEREFLSDKIKPDVEFKLGTYPFEIGYGKIIKIIE